ncbi:hypothetical protein P280DRAFT_296990 [Massarina eburnea CBS 473.64]|uniref:Uncharacterized protein n=1 Tax=Massarina eburnea CBS 473.64 TaxID=1395130 RepID=A0A6A6S4K0_9PLEO|nr:hypothetical protein P280DRAFT_296990 [Massarina eburnea CBS 473.64]
MRVRLDVERYRLEQWVNTARRSRGGEEQVFDDASTAIMGRILNQQQTILDQLERFEKTYSDRIQGGARRGWARQTTKSVSLRILWAKGGRKRYTNLITQLSTLNGALQEILEVQQRQSIVIRQEYTETRISRIEKSIGNITQMLANSPGLQDQREKQGMLEELLESKGNARISASKTLDGITLAQGHKKPGSISTPDVEQNEWSAKIEAVREFQRRSRSLTAFQDKMRISSDSNIGSLKDKDIIEAEAAKEQPVVGEISDPTISAHQLMEHADTISRDNWKDLLEKLPANLRWGLKYSESGRSAAWTYIPSSVIKPTSIPLTIAGIPVVIPIRYKYPIRVPSAPPPDPRPFLIDPDQVVSDSIIEDVFTTFEGIRGFYLLLNGYLQLLIPDDYDLEDALNRNPSRFGGLEVSYVYFSILSTASSGDQPTAKGLTPPATSNITELRDTAQVPVHSETSGRLPQANRNRSIAPYELDFSHIIRARVKKRGTPSWFKGIQLFPLVLHACCHSGFGRRTS